MRALLAAVLIAAAGCGAWTAAARSQDAGGLPAPADGPATPPAPPSPVLVVGDSLAVGMEPFLGALLEPATVVWDVRSGRTTPQGLLHLRARLREVTPRAVVLSLGTNDGPDPGRFADRIRRALQVIPPRACVVWLDVNRPPRKGRYAALNRVLYAAAGHDLRVVLVHWDHAVLAGKVALPDGLHPDAAGFEYRSRLVAAALTRCRV